MKGFLKPVLANHNHEHFEIYAFAELSKEDHVTKQYQSYVDHWIPTQNLTDQQMVQKIRDLEIDILVDLAGHTKEIVWVYLPKNQLLFQFHGGLDMVILQVLLL